MNNYNCIIILGPTASGKTKLAVKTALHTNAEIISIDSRQVYRKLDIGTGKDLYEYSLNGQKISYHLIDICQPYERLNVFDFANSFYRVFEDINRRKKTPVLCGGTGLYFDALLKKNNLIAVPINTEFRKSITTKTKEELMELFESFNYAGNYRFDTSTLKRLIRSIEILMYLKSNPVPTIKFHNLNPLIIGVKTTLEQRRKNISMRLKLRLENGLIEEAENLLNEGISHEQLLYFGLEYKFLSLYLSGKITHTQLFAQLETAIHQYSKRQMTWWRKMEREGFNINWVEGFEEVKKFLL